MMNHFFQYWVKTSTEGFGLRICRRIVLTLCFVFLSTIQAQGIQSLVLNTLPSQADWFFSGRVHNEHNEYYDYFFKIQQHDKTVNLEAVLVSVANQQVILFERGTPHVVMPDQHKWQTDTLFLSYNPISNRWILSGKNKEGVSFNFKIDMLAQQSFGVSKKLPFQPALQLDMNKTGRLNGHIRLGPDKEDEFVSENSAWFSQIWSDDANSSMAMTLVLCDFDDDQGFFTMKSKDQKVPHAFSYWRNADGRSVPISQFLHMNMQENALIIQSSLPKMQLHVQNLLPKPSDADHEVIMGRVSGYRSAGFCMQHDIG